MEKKKNFEILKKKMSKERKNEKEWRKNAGELAEGLQKPKNSTNEGQPAIRIQPANNQRF